MAYVTLLAVGACGVGRAPLWSIVMGAITLSVLTWGEERWRETLRRGREVDSEWRELAALAWMKDMPLRAFGYFLQARMAAFIVAVHVVHNLFFSAASYVTGVATGWVWGIR